MSYGSPCPGKVNSVIRRWQTRTLLPDPEDYGTTITLQLTVFDEGTECEAVDFLDLTIYRSPEVNAGEDIINLQGSIDRPEWICE